MVQGSKAKRTNFQGTGQLPDCLLDVWVVVFLVWIFVVGFRATGSVWGV